MKKLLLFSVGLMSLMTPAVSHAAETPQQRVVVTNEGAKTWSVMIASKLNSINSEGNREVSYKDHGPLTSHMGSSILYEVDPFEGYIPKLTQITYTQADSKNGTHYVEYDGKQATLTVRFVDETGTIIKDDLLLNHLPLTVGGSYKVDLPTIPGYISKNGPRLVNKISSVSEVVEAHYQKVNPKAISPEKPATATPQAPKLATPKPEALKPTNPKVGTPESGLKKTDETIDSKVAKTDQNSQEKPTVSTKTMRPQLETEKSVSADKPESTSGVTVSHDQKAVAVDAHQPSRELTKDAEAGQLAVNPESSSLSKSAVQAGIADKDGHSSESAVKNGKVSHSDQTVSPSKTDGAKTGETPQDSKQGKILEQKSGKGSGENDAQNKLETVVSQTDDKKKDPATLPAQKSQSTGEDLKQPVETGADQSVTSSNADGKQGVAKSGHQKSKTNKNKKSHQHKHQAAKNTKDNKNTASQPKKFLVQAVDETGAEIYSKSMNTTAEKLQHENFELFGYDLEKTTPDNDQNRYVLHYRRKAVTLKVRAVDESGAALETTQLTGKFGNSLSYTAQVIPGYHVVGNSGGTVKLDSLFPADVTIRYAKDHVESAKPVPAANSQMTAISNPPAASQTLADNGSKDAERVNAKKKSAHKRTAKSTKTKKHHVKKNGHKRAKQGRRLKRHHGRSLNRRHQSRTHGRAGRQHSVARLPQTGDASTKKSQMIGLGLLLALVGPKIARKF